MSRGCYDDVNDFSRQHYVWRKLWVTKKPIGFYRLKWQYLTLPRHFIRMAMHIGFTAKWLAAFGFLLDVAKPSLQVKRLCKNGAQFTQ